MARFFPKETFYSPLATQGLTQQPLQLECILTMDSIHEASSTTEVIQKAEDFKAENRFFPVSLGDITPPPRWVPGATPTLQGRFSDSESRAIHKTPQGVPTPAPSIFGLWLFEPAFNSCILFYYFLKNLFIYYFWLHWIFIAARGLSLVAASGGCSSLRCAGFSLRWLLLLRSTGSRRAGFRSCGLRALERRLSRCGSLA